MIKIIIPLLSPRPPSIVLSADLTCWDRNIDEAQDDFNFRAAAENSFPEYNKNSSFNNA